MLATENFQTRLSPQDRAMLKRVAMHFQRTQADTIKTLVREVYELMTPEAGKETQLKARLHGEGSEEQNVSP